MVQYKDQNNLTAHLKEKAREMGFSMVGVVEARPSPHLDAYFRWIHQDYHGTMGWMARPDRQERRQDLDVILPGVQSIVCVGLDYDTIQLPPEIADDAGRGRISNYAWGADYHDVMTPRLKELGAWLRRQVNDDVRDKAYVDTGAILERDHAAEAGLGFTGKNTMLIGPRRGSWFFLGELLTTAALTPDRPRETMPGCGTCRRCLDACPTDAFPEPYVVDARRCISYLTIEHKGAIPRHLRPQMGNWVYGCDVCQVVCPFNRFAVESHEDAFWPKDVDAAAPPLAELLALDEEAFRKRYAGSPIERIGRGRLVRNACVAAGNWASPQATPHLARLLTDVEPLVRGHAAWALGQIGDGEATAALGAALEEEGDAEVRKELAAALEAAAQQAG